MNNKKILVVGVLVVIVTMMVGYALFSENITINGTATAKGDFSITTTCQTGLPSDSTYNSTKTYFEGRGYIEGGYDDDSCIVNGNTVTMKTNLKYPTAARYFTVTFKNTGSIPAIYVDYNHTREECRDLDGDGVAETCDNSFDIEALREGKIYLIKQDGTTFDPEDPSADLSEFTDAENNIILSPNQGFAITYMYMWDKNQDKDVYNGILNTSQDTIVYEFIQINN